MTELDPRDDEISGLDRLSDAGSQETLRRSDVAFPSARRAQPLTNLELRDVPAEPGYYAAWVRDESALAETGVGGPAPRLLYVGKAVGGLRKRLKRHVDGGLPGLPSILASRGVVLFAFGDWYLPDLEGRMVPETPLTAIARQQVRDWQQRHICWAWTVCGRNEAVGAERAAIRSRAPLLNTQFSPSGPLYLRASTAAARARARWLWHASWAALTLEQPRGFRTPAEEDRWLEVTVDEAGFPLPFHEGLADRGNALQTIPSPRNLRDIMCDAARHADVWVRDAVGRTRGTAELEVWWAAHAGAPFLASPMTVESAIASSLRQEPEISAPCPSSVPRPGDRVRELIGLADTLDGVFD